jgi:mRNA interferase RelE/StbE
MYELSYSEKVLKQLKKLEIQDKERVIKSLERIRIRPHYFIKRIVGTKYFRFRAGNYRIILDLVNKNLIIYVIEVKHRRNVYKK